MNEITLAIRRLMQARGFTFVCLLTLALGIGGTTAVFTLVQQVLLAQLPVPRPAELFRLGDDDQCCVNSGVQSAWSLFSYDLYRSLRDTLPQFTELAAFQAHPNPISVRRVAGDPAEAFAGQFVSGNYFQMFGIAAAIGRPLVPSDDRAGAAPVAVVSYPAWQHRFGGDPHLIGQTVAINAVASVIVGVAPAGFYGEMLRPDPPDFWIPLSSEPLLEPQSRLIAAPGSHWLYLIGRLRPGSSPAEAQNQAAVTVRQWLTASADVAPDDRKRIPQVTVRLSSAAAGVASMRNVIAPALLLLFATAGATLLIACGNLANLLLARGLGRRVEFAVRTALGASRARLVRGTLIESLLLSLGGAAAGLLVSYAGAHAMVAMAFRGATYVPIEPSPSLAVLGFAFAVALLTGTLFGIAPALIGSKADPIDAMRGSGRIAGDPGSFVRRALVAVHVALSLSLVTTAGLLARNLDNLERQDFGFRTDGRYVAGIDLALGGAPAERLAAAYKRLPEAVGAIPGVRRVAFSLYSPMNGDNWAGRIAVEGHAAAEVLESSWNRVSPHYFETIGTPLLRGRAIDERDTASSTRVAVVNEAFARAFFVNGDAIGRHFGFADLNGAGRPDYEIIGIVGDAKYQDPREPAYRTFFLPFLQREPTPSTKPPAPLPRSHYAHAIELHVTRPGQNFEPELRRALATVDPGITLERVISLDEQVALNFNGERLIATLTVAFGGMALLLACVGLYGVTTYAVSRRTREIGVRMAIGATRARVLATVLRGALIQVAIGFAIGVPLTIVAARLVAQQLYGVSAHDTRTLAAAAIVLSVSAALAAFIPARRAALMDPQQALRME